MFTYQKWRIRVNILCFIIRFLSETKSVIGGFHLNFGLKNDHNNTKCPHNLPRGWDSQS